MKFTATIAGALLGFALLMVSGCASTQDGVLVSYDDRGSSVTGSRIRKKVEDPEAGSAPVRIYGREGMKSTGARSVGDFVGGGG